MSKIQVTRVYDQTIKAFNDDFKIVCHEGGSRSSKTWSIIQFFLIKALAGEEISVTIVRDKLTWIKSTILLDFKKMCKLYGIEIKPQININRAEQLYDINGSEFAFYGLDYAEKLHGRSQDWFWINEVMEVGQKHFDQLEMRTNVGAILDYNPYNDLHWVFDLHKRDDVKFIKSTMLDNDFLPDQIRKKILSYKPTKDNIRMGTADNYMWQVYGLGNKTKLKGSVFTNWDTVDRIPLEAKFIGYGQDFGYTNDPTSVVALYTMNNELYWDQLVYRKGLTNQDIVSEYVKLEIGKLEEIFADSSEPKSIDEIRRNGYNIRGAKKGADSINFGIDILKGYKMHITKNSPDLENELRKYKYQEDKIGNIINKPIDAFNHCFTGNTKITTNKGLVNIKDIKRGDMVLTRGGYRRVLKRFDNGLKEVWTYRIVSDNIEVELEATPDHKILTKRGWKQISKLEKGDTIYLHKSIEEKSIANTKGRDTIVVALVDCTRSFGRTITENYQRVLRYIIRILTPRTTRLETLLSSRSSNTESYTKEILQRSRGSKGERTLMKMQDQKQSSGTRVRRVENGTLNTQRSSMKTGNILKKSANSVGRNTKLDTQELVSIVIQTVNKKQEIGELKRVYDLMIKDNHEYLANGVLVHNCVDAMRYIAVMKLGKKPELQFIARGRLGI